MKTLKKFTAEEIQAQIPQEDRQKMLVSLETSDEVPSFMKNDPKLKDVWVTGCWLGEMLKAAGCPDGQRQSICMAHGQKSLFGEPFKAAAQAWNAYVDGRPEHGGQELAEKISDEVFRSS